MPKWEKTPMVGKRFGRWVVMAQSERKAGKALLYWCQCDCGTKKEVLGGRLRSGGSLSCGCLTREETKKSNSTHGLSRHPIYHLWSNIKKRCYVKTAKQYSDYGGRGISMYPEWENDFLKFYDWCLANGWERGLSFDRMNNDGNYEPSNHRWATSAIQNRNTRRNRNITINGETHCVTDWAAVANVNPRAIFGRLKRGWDEYSAVFGKN